MAEDVHLSRLKSFINECGGVTLAAWKLNVRPSTLKKLLTGQVLSAPTREKLGDILEHDSPPKLPKGKDHLKIIRSKLRGMIKDKVDIVEASSRFSVNPSTIQKILEGSPVSPDVQNKIRAALESGTHQSNNAKPSMVEKLKQIHFMYEELGTLDAVGKRIGLTRERIRQLLSKGSELGLFEYKPFDYPFVPKEKILADYGNHLNLGRVAKVNNISPPYLRKLLTAYRITDEDLRALWLAGHKIRCADAYSRIKDQLGYHPTTTELQRSKSWRYLSMKITRLWGSFDAFREELNIPKPPSFKEATRPWHEHRQRLALIRRMQYLDRIRECLRQSGVLMSASQIAFLTIREQGELLNQIAGTYKDFYRAAMEYVDNAVDAATILLQSGASFKPSLNIHVETAAKKLTFTDNCGGMTPEELCDLLSEVGKSKKKAVPWANGQFGFGVHAFRAFAREAVFISHKKGNPEAKIKIDRAVDENVDVPCETTDGKQLDKPGTRVIISRFDPQVFKKQVFVKALVSEIEHHFDDVLRAGLIKIEVTEDNSRAYECRSFNFSDLPGVALKKELPVRIDGTDKRITVDLKILDRVQDNRLPVLTNKQRRVQTMADLKSYKNFLRNKGESSYVWSNPFVTGFIEINDLCSPNLTRDDLRDSPARDVLYDRLVEVQKELQALVDETMDRKTQESFKKLGNVMSDCLSRILRGFKLQFEQLAPTGKPGQFEKKLLEAAGDIPFGGDEPGGGGARLDLAISHLWMVKAEWEIATLEEVMRPREKRQDQDGLRSKLSVRRGHGSNSKITPAGTASLILATL